MADAEEIKWLRKQLHSPDMQCRQCNLTRQILDELEASRG